MLAEGITVSKVRVVLADDHREVIAKVRGVLGDEYDVLESVENGRQAVTAVSGAGPGYFCDRYLHAAS